MNPVASCCFLCILLLSLHPAAFSASYCFLCILLLSLHPVSFSASYVSCYILLHPVAFSTSFCFLYILLLSLYPVASSASYASCCILHLHLVAFFAFCCFLCILLHPVASCCFLCILLHPVAFYVSFCILLLSLYRVSSCCFPSIVLHPEVFYSSCCILLHSLPAAPSRPPAHWYSKLHLSATLQQRRDGCSVYLKFCSFILHDTALLFIQDTLFPLQHTFPTTQNITHTFLLQGIFYCILTIQEPKSFHKIGKANGWTQRYVFVIFWNILKEKKL